MTELPAEVREKAARAAFDKFGQPILACGPAVVDNFFLKEAGRWRAVVDAVVEVLAEHQGSVSASGSARWVRVASLVEKEGFPTEAVIDAVADLVDERDNLRAERDRFKEAWRSESIRLLNTLDAADRKLSRQRKRRKAAEAELRKTMWAYGDLSGAQTQLEAERDALLARVENLRAALEQGAREDICEVYTPAIGWTDCRDVKGREAWCPACVNRDALAADDRAAGRTEENSDG